MRSQNARLLETLKKGASVTPHYALHALSISRLASRALDLKQAGYPVESAWVEVQNQYGETCRVKSYFLAKSA